MKFATQKLVTIMILGACAGAALNACAPLVVGGVAVGTMMAVDRRTAGTQVEDQGIEVNATNRIAESLGDRAHVNITSYNRQVLLTGEAPTAQDRELVEQLVAKVPNVRNVVNEIAIMGNSTFSERSSDSLVTAKVKSNLLDFNDLFANIFKVVTERGTVYLMGQVTQAEANRATEIARSTSGVKKVVRVLEIISEAELKALQPAPAASAASAPKS